MEYYTDPEKVSSVVSRAYMFVKSQGFSVNVGTDGHGRLRLQVLLDPDLQYYETLFIAVQRSDGGVEYHFSLEERGTSLRDDVKNLEQSIQTTCIEYQKLLSQEYESEKVRHGAKSYQVLLRKFPNYRRYLHKSGAGFSLTFEGDFDRMSQILTALQEDECPTV